MANDLLGSSANGGLVSEVKFDEFDRNIGVAFLDFSNDRLNFALVTAGEDDELGFTSGEENCGLGPKTTFAGAGDEDWTCME